MKNKIFLGICSVILLGNTVNANEFVNKKLSPRIEALASMNISVSIPDGTGPTCYLQFGQLDSKKLKASVESGKLLIKWSYSTAPGWTRVLPWSGARPYPVKKSTCGSYLRCLSTSLIDSLLPNQVYYFAARVVDAKSGARSSWSNEVPCKPSEEN